MQRDLFCNNKSHILCNRSSKHSIIFKDNKNQNSSLIKPWMYISFFTNLYFCYKQQCLTQRNNWRQINIMVLSNNENFTKFSLVSFICAILSRKSSEAINVSFARRQQLTKEDKRCLPKPSATRRETLNIYR